MLIKSREEGFREAIEILGYDQNNNDQESHMKPSRSDSKKHRDIRQMIKNELSYSGKPMTKQQIAKAIGYAVVRTEAVLKRLEQQNTISQNTNGLWEINL
jgi:hypothetical protein